MLAQVSCINPKNSLSKQPFHPVQSNLFKCQKWYFSFLSDLVFLSIRWTTCDLLPRKLSLQDLNTRLHSPFLITKSNQLSLLLLISYMIKSNIFFFFSSNIYQLQSQLLQVNLSMFIQIGSFYKQNQFKLKLNIFKFGKSL